VQNATSARITLERNEAGGRVGTDGMCWDKIKFACVLITSYAASLLLLLRNVMLEHAYIAVLNDVLPSLLPKTPRLFHGLFRSFDAIVLELVDLGADETLLEVGVNRAGGARSEGALSN